MKSKRKSSFFFHVLGISFFPDTFLLHRHKIMAKIHLLVNLKSGSNRGEKSLKQIETVLKNEKMDYDIHISNYPGQLVPLATKVANEISFGTEYVIVVGGDGSLNQALNGVKNSEQPNTPPCLLPSRHWK